MNTGKILTVSGPVVDCGFETGQLPAIREALHVTRTRRSSRDGGRAAAFRDACALRAAGRKRAAFTRHAGRRRPARGIQCTSR